MKTLFLAAGIILLSGLNTVSAGSFEEKKFDAGIASGLLMPGDVYISLHGDNVKQKSNFMLKAFADAYIIPQLAFGAYFSYSSLNLKNDIEVFGKTIKKSGTPIWEIGASMKPRFVFSEKFAVKPGIMIGHRQFAGDNSFTKWTGLALNGSCELQYRISEKLILYQESGFVYQPYGGNVDTDVTFDPKLYFLLGIAL